MAKDLNQEYRASVVNETTCINLEKVRRKSYSDIEQKANLALKMQCVNDALDEIGFTRYQLKLFFLNGFGYAVDSLLILLNALTQPQVAMQYKPVVSKAQTICMGVGLLFGALFWGLGADVSQSVPMIFDTIFIEIIDCSLGRF